ncbi:hypothetical protein VST7929_03266 [Vibrio stylophorae]|uniref:Manganese transporter n=1 Tax=Vibrio stylophorae TaxID=659351 RepID=A0ABM8ZY69_9VIBR|nr:putative manganese transporter [Vibrio stylophorae]CAH0535792.1 hypothetical protein VST7929_03266 [Vibrio stylophorae]
MQQAIKLLKTQRWQLKNKRLILPITLFALLLTPQTYAVTKAVLADAFWQVAAYVAATLMAYHYISQKLSQKSRFSQAVYQNPTAQVVFASIMGALPGCGGAIIIVTQFVRRQMGFGSVVAVLTATMGDAAFLLLAAKPMDGLFMIALGAGIGIASGMIVNRVHKPEFMMPVQKADDQSVTSCCRGEECSEQGVRAQGQFWRWAILPAIVIAIMGSFQMDTDAFFHLPAGSTEVLGMALAVLAMVLWAVSRDVVDYQSAVSEDPKQQTARLFQKVAQDTNFVASWVIVAFLIFELTIYFTGWDLAALFSNYLVLMPLMGAVIGLLPGCGPQILVTGLYLQGAVPFSAQIANGISNDGDALFPAIALAPKAALVATVYSIIPALIAGYGYFLLFE